jgi:hypothetical protein
MGLLADVSGLGCDTCGFASQLVHAINLDAILGPSTDRQVSHEVLVGRIIQALPAQKATEGGITQKDILDQQIGFFV